MYLRLIWWLKWTNGQSAEHKEGIYLYTNYIVSKLL
uniref:Uncharacterized protein n=1 Tax=Lepeophtheirus salmonis TaxID=72036 RepID=A0A0K2TMI0_LEPSM